MTNYLNSREIMGIALLRAGACAIRDGIENLRGRLQELGLYDALTDALSLMDQADSMAMNTCADEDSRTGLERRLSTYKIGLYHAKPECKELHIVDDRDMQTLVGHALNFCDLECPCVTVDEDGSRTVNKAAVKGCEMRKMFKRLLLSEGASVECPYSTLI